MRKLNGCQWALVGLVFVSCLAGASLLQTQYCPDEWARKLISDYIVQHGRLPVGEEEELILGEYGFSYAIYPYLAAMVNALFMKLTSLFTGSERALLAASRMCSVISVSLAALYAQKIGNMVFRRRTSSVLFASLLCFMPQVMFLGMYHNNDSLALSAVVAVLYCVLSGSRNHWRIRDCLHLTVWVSVGLLSYYNAYGWLLCCAVVVIISFLRDRKITGKETALKWAGILGGILLLAGWFFIRNAALHNGDFLGFATEATDRQRLLEQGWTFKSYRRPSEIPGYTLFRMLTEDRCTWMVWLLKSFIGMFGNMNIPMRGWMYFVYYAMILLAVCCGIALLARKGKSGEEKTILITLAAASGITLALTVINSWYTDYQPQGRYIITVLILLAYLIAAETDRGFADFRLFRIRKTENGAAGSVGDGTEAGRDGRTGVWIAVGLTAGWIGMYFVVFFTVMRQMF